MEKLLKLRACGGGVAEGHAYLQHEGTRGREKNIFKRGSSSKMIGYQWRCVSELLDGCEQLLTTETSM